MSYQIITLSSKTMADGSFNVSGIFWLTAPSNLVVPAPTMTSQNPHITAAQLLSLQTGTLVEQSFTTGLYAFGTSLASVQADLQTQYTAAQTALNNLAPVNSNMVGVVYDGTSWYPPTSPMIAPSTVLLDAAPLTSGSQSAVPAIGKSFVLVVYQE